MYLHEYREDSSLFPRMNVNEAISIGLLVVNDDVACQNKVAKVLRRCNYEVLHTGTVYDALHAIWENTDRLDLVVTNLQKLESEGLAIIQNIKRRLKLNVLLIRSDGRIEPKGELLSFSAYALNGLSINSFNNLLENAKRVNEDLNQQENVEKASISAIETSKASPSMKDETRLNQKGKAADFYGERSEDSNDDHQKGKKPRVTWTNEMHQKFLDAIDRLGYEKAVPKKIVEVMGVPGLTRENVASHLQKYRCSMRRTQETILGGSLPCRSTRNEIHGLSVLTSPSNMPSFPQSSYLPTVKEPKLQYIINAGNDLAFGSRSERQFYSRIGSDLSGVRNMMQRRDKHSSVPDNSDTNKFVGYRFIGNQIDYGLIKTNTDSMMSTSERLKQQSSTSYVQNHPIPDQRIGIGSSLLESSSSRFHGTETAGITTINSSQEPDFLSSCSSKIEDLFRGPPTLNYVRQSGDCSGTLLDQNASILSLHQDFSSLRPENDISEQNTAAFLDDILRRSPPPPLLPQMFQDLDEVFESDDSFMNAIGNTYDPFDVQEFDDTLFSQQDN